MSPLAEGQPPLIDLSVAVGIPGGRQGDLLERVEVPLARVHQVVRRRQALALEQRLVEHDAQEDGLVIHVDPVGPAVVAAHHLRVVAGEAGNPVEVVGRQHVVDRQDHVGTGELDRLGDAGVAEDVDDRIAVQHARREVVREGREVPLRELDLDVEFRLDPLAPLLLGAAVDVVLVRPAPVVLQPQRRAVQIHPVRAGSQRQRQQRKGREHPHDRPVLHGNLLFGKTRLWLAGTGAVTSGS